jgi:hypothetical protein
MKEYAVFSLSVLDPQVSFAWRDGNAGSRLGNDAKSSAAKSGS